MSKCARVEPIVKKVLEEKPYTREDDFALVYEVFKEFLPNIDDLSFQDVCLITKNMDYRILKVLEELDQNYKINILNFCRQKQFKKQENWKKQTIEIMLYHRRYYVRIIKKKRI